MTSWLPVTFDAVWRRAVTDGPERVFLRFEGRDGDVTEWTYSEFDRVVEGAAARFEAAGVTPGDAVHLALTNSPTFVAAWLAAIRVGAWIVPSDPMSTAAELTEHISRTKPVVGFCATERAGTYRSVPGDARPRTVIDVDESDPDLPWLTPTAPADRPRPSIRDRAAVMFTSGTTGRPKGVEITQANYAFAGATMAAASDLGPDDRQLVVLPMFHANAQYYSFASAIAVGASVALMPTFSASRFVEQAARHQATCASLFAGPIRMILARGGPLLRSPATQAAPGRSLAGARSLAVSDGSSPPPLRVRHCWFAQNLTPAQYDTIAEWLGCRPRQLYGMTETIPAVLTDERDDPHCDTMGYVTEGCTVDLQGGEVVVGGEPGLTLFAGYLDDQDTTAASFRNGWFLTGDRATRDEGGRYRFDGRRSDVLKVAGENVSTVEVEQVLAAHPDVADVAVVGVPDEVRDEVPLAFIVPAADASPAAGLQAALEAWCVERLGKAKRPREYRFVDELPRTSVGKIKKYMLRESRSRT
jgi:crotonobetaine/carnitine-CoA ligase